MSIPLLLVCDGAESKQAALEGLVKNEPGLKYIATVSMQEGTRAVERAVKVGAKLIWIDLDEEPVEGLNLLAETRKLHPMLNVIVSRSQLDPDMVRAALQLGALDFLDSSRAAQQLNVVVENLHDSAQMQATVSQAELQAQTIAPQAAGSRVKPSLTAGGQSQTVEPPEGGRVKPSLATGGSQADTQAQTIEPQTDGRVNPNLTHGSSNKWGNLDSIPTPGTKGLPHNQEVTGEIHVANSGIQNPVAQQPVQTAGQPVSPTAELPAGGSKWGDLDSIPAPASSITAGGTAPAPAVPVVDAAPAASTTTGSAAPAASAPPIETTPAAVQPNVQATAQAAPLPAPAAPPASSAPASAASPVPISAALAESTSSNGGKWGDLDAIPTPKATQELAVPKATSEVTKPLSALDAIPTPMDKPAVPLPKPEPHAHTNKALRPSPEKAELYSMGSPIWMATIIIIIIFAAIAFMFLKQHH